MKYFVRSYRARSEPVVRSEKEACGCGKQEEEEAIGKVEVGIYGSAPHRSSGHAVELTSAVDGFEQASDRV